MHPSCRPACLRPIPRLRTLSARRPATGPCAVSLRYLDNSGIEMKCRRMHRRRAPRNPAGECFRSRSKCRSSGSPVIYVGTAVPEIPDKSVGIGAAALRASLLPFVVHENLQNEWTRKNAPAPEDRERKEGMRSNEGCRLHS